MTYTSSFACKYFSKLFSVVSLELYFICCKKFIRVILCCYDKLCVSWSPLVFLEVSFEVFLWFAFVFLWTLLFSLFFFWLIELIARIVAYVNTMLDYIDFLGVTNSYQSFRERFYLHQLTIQVHFDHAFIPMFLLHLVASLQQPSSSDIEFL